MIQHNQQLPPILRLDPKEFDNTIKKGKLKDRIILFIKDKTAPVLTEEQREALIKSFNSPAQKRAEAAATEYYVACAQYGRHLLTLRKIYQTEIEALVRLHAIARGYDREIFILNKMLFCLREGDMTAKIENRPLNLYDPNEVLDYLRRFWSGNNGEIILEVKETGIDKEGRPIYEAYANIDEKDGLKEKIEEKAEDTLNAKLMLNAGIDAFINFLLKETRISHGVKLVPYNIFLLSSVQDILSNPYYSYWMDDPEERRFYESKLKEKYINGGLSISEEDLLEVVLENLVDQEADQEDKEKEKLYLEREQKWIKHYFHRFCKQED